MLAPVVSSMSENVLVVANCGQLPECRAMLRWVMPVLQEWPETAWTVWMCDATDCEHVQAALMDTLEAVPKWQDVDTSSFDHDNPICRMLEGNAGLIVLAHDVIARAVLRTLDGLVSGQICISTSDPLVMPLRRSFASLGARAGL